MPYINQDKRQYLDPAVDAIVQALRELECDSTSNNTEGNINYVFTRVLRRVYPGGSYGEINDAMGIIHSVGLEYYRRVASPYEDQKAFDNGDVE